MNQILFVDDKKNNSSIDIKKIVIFFAVSIIIIGFVMVGEGSYSVYAYYKNNKENKTGITEEEANVQLIQTENNQLNIHINSNIGISELIYKWNSDTAVTLPQNGKTSINEQIDIPIGQNTINIRVIDINGKETRKDETFTVTAEKPVIELSLVGDKIKIAVGSKVELANITYKWNADNVNTIDMITYEDKKNFEKEIEIPKGQNTLLITATDINGNISEKSQEVKGVTKPKIKIYVQGADLHFNVTAEETIKYVEFTFNGKTYKIDSAVVGEKTEIHYKMPLIEGMNYIKITANTISEAKEDYIGKYNYQKPQ